MKMNQLYKRKQEFMTLHQHTKIQVELKSLADKKKKILEEISDPDMPPLEDVPRYDEDAPSDVPTTKHGYTHNPQAEQVFAKHSRKNWLSERLTFLYQAKADINKEIY